MDMITHWSMYSVAAMLCALSADSTVTIPGIKAVRVESVHKMKFFLIHQPS